jgi:hypothetical protein
MMRQSGREISILPLLLLVGFSIAAPVAVSPAGAEARKISGTAKVMAVLAQTMMTLGDKPGHEVSLIRHLELDNSADPNFDNIEYDVVETTDYVTGSGMHHGYRVSTMTGGDKLYSAYEGTTNVAARPGAFPEVTFAGKWWFTGGTGKFAGITGGGTYKGQAGSAGVTWDWQGDYDVKK